MIKLTLTAWIFRFASCIVPKTRKNEGNLHGNSESDVMHEQPCPPHIFLLKEEDEKEIFKIWNSFFFFKLLWGRG